ncbi:GD24117 [Drosophila simulans]|uniref:GD24117 n=1 Tax=Drosophila simulans TaxID=7240 RepID=B4Q7Z9_DROSI|nr:GD24117 [Drosophila simulans]
MILTVMMMMVMMMVMVMVSLKCNSQTHKLAHVENAMQMRHPLSYAVHGHIGEILGCTGYGRIPGPCSSFNPLGQESRTGQAAQDQQAVSM